MDFKGLAYLIITQINYTIPVLIGVALVLFITGAIRYMYKTDDAKGRQAEKDLLGWGLLALFLLVSIMGILQVLAQVFFGGTPQPSGGPSTLPLYL